MTFLEELNSVLVTLNIPLETGVFSDEPPDEYLVITPMTDSFYMFADNKPNYTLSEARLSLFSKGNYIQRKKEITNVLLAAGFTITDRNYVGYEEDTKYHHYAIDVMKEYEEEDK